MIPDGYTTVLFTRPINNLYLTTTGSKKISFDGGNVFMDLQSNAYQTFYHLQQYRIDFSGAGSVNGMGMAN